MIFVAGDLSTRNLGVVAVPSSWSCDFSRVQFDTFETTAEDGDLVELRDALARDFVAWVRWARGLDEVEVWFEGYPTRGHVYNLDTLCELGGVIKHELRRELGIVVRMGPIASARRVLGVPNNKPAAQAAVRAITDVFDTEHERDAFVVANYALSEHDLPFVTIAPSRPSRTVRGKVRRRARGRSSRRKAA